MPCYDSRNDASYLNRELQDKCNRLTRLLCEVMSDNSNIVASVELQIWWRKHQEIDRQRVLKEKRDQALAENAQKIRQERKEVIEGLTPRQRELLNL